MAPRKHSLEFKKQVIDEVVRGGLSQAQVCRKYGLSSSVVFEWKKRLQTGTLEASPGAQDPRLKTYEIRIGELERMVGRLAMENDLLKKAEAWMRKQRRRDSLVITAKNLEAYQEGVK